MEELLGGFVLLAESLEGEGGVSFGEAVSFFI